MVLSLLFTIDAIQVATYKAPFKAAGKNLSALRSKKGLTQERAAERIGISLKYYQALEGGVKAPAFVTLCRIRRILDASWNDLLHGC